MHVGDRCSELKEVQRNWTDDIYSQYDDLNNLSSPSNYFKGNVIKSNELDCVVARFLRSDLNDPFPLDQVKEGLGWKFSHWKRLNITLFSK